MTKTDISQRVLLMGIVNGIPSEVLLAGLLIAVGTLVSTVDDDQDRETLLGLTHEDICMVVAQQRGTGVRGAA